MKLQYCAVAFMTISMYGLNSCPRMYVPSDVVQAVGNLNDASYILVKDYIQNGLSMPQKAELSCLLNQRRDRLLISKRIASPPAGAYVAGLITSGLLFCMSLHMMRCTTVGRAKKVTALVASSSLLAIVATGCTVKFVYEKYNCDEQLERIDQLLTLLDEVRA